MQTAEVVTSILNARPSQLREWYDARDPRAPLYSYAACGVRPIAKPPIPRRRIALHELVRVFEYESVLASKAASTKATTSAEFTSKQLERIASVRKHVD
jgi:hypothetical protein